MRRAFEWIGGVHGVLLVWWLTGGAVLSVIWREWIPWLTFLSIYAIWSTHAAGMTAFRAKRAAQNEDGDN